MFLLDFSGALLSLITWLFLGISGYLLARLALRARAGEEAGEDPLALAIAALLAATAEGTLIGLVLGKLGLLRIEIALALLAAVTLVLLRQAKKSGEDLWAPARLLGRRTADRLRENAALSILAFHAAGSEALRGLLRPPLSWDSLMYHLLTVATWLQDGRIAPIFGSHPMSFYGYMPANGAVWLWWWMAPSHSEIYANLAFFPQTALLALATGGVARELGARRHWPLAAFLTLLTPAVIRFAATQYVDIFLAAALVAAGFFALRWTREPRWGEVLLAGAGLGLTAGTKVLGLPYALALAGMAVVAARGEWRRRVPQVAAALGLLLLLGGVFYAQNVAAGAGPLAARCEGTPGAAAGPDVPRMPRPNTVLALLGPMLREGRLLDAFLGIAWPAGSVEMGIGPQVFLLLASLLLPLVFLRTSPWERRAALVVWSQIAVQLLLWVAVPYASSGHIFANIRYIIGALGLAFAAVAALAERTAARAAKIAERCPDPSPGLQAIAIALAAQSLLQLHAEMPRGVRLALALLDLAAVALVLSPALRGRLRRRARGLAVAGLLLALCGAPWLARFRVADRARAFLQEYTTHDTSANNQAAAWRWLDLHGGNGTVAVQSTPINFFVYPAMGPHLERRAVYANINRQDFRNAADYPGCDPRIDPDPQAWVENLAKLEVRWIHLTRFPQVDYPLEHFWAAARPDLFAVRHEDELNIIYEFLPVAGAQDRREPR